MFLIRNIPNSFFISSRQIRRQAESEEVLMNTSELEKYQEWLKKQLVLRENIQAACSHYGISARVPLESGHFMYDDDHKLLFCRIAKVLPA